MVLWEIAVATAYFLGLKRTYKHALKIQRRLIGPNHPNIRQFLHRVDLPVRVEKVLFVSTALVMAEAFSGQRTRTVFDIALKVHRNIQQRDLEVGRSVSNWLLRFFDKLKPSANITGTAVQKLPPPKNGSMTQITANNIQKNGVPRSSAGSSEKGSSDRHLFSTARKAWHRSFPTMSMMMQPSGVTGIRSTTQFRHLSVYRPEVWGLSREGGRFFTGIRPDILMWMQRK